MPGQHEAGGGKGDHQDRDHRQEREIGDSRPKLIAEPVIEALCGAQQMGDHRVALHFGRRSGDGLQRLAGFCPTAVSLRASSVLLLFSGCVSGSCGGRRSSFSGVIRNFFLFTARFSKKYTLNAVSCRNASPRRPFSSRAAQSTYAFISPPSHSINRFTRRRDCAGAGRSARPAAARRGTGQDLNQVAGA